MGLQQAACRISQNKRSHGQALRNVFWMKVERGPDSGGKRQLRGQQSVFEATDVQRDNTWDRIIRLDLIITLDEASPAGSRIL